MPFALAAAFRACSLAALPTPPIPPPSTLSVPAIGVEPVAAPEASGATPPPPPPAGGPGETAVLTGGEVLALAESAGLAGLQPAKTNITSASVRKRMLKE